MTPLIETCQARIERMEEAVDGAVRSRDQMGTLILESFEATIADLRQLHAALEKNLAGGTEGSIFLRTLRALRLQLVRVHNFCARTKPTLEEWPRGATAMSRLEVESEGFAAWVDELLALLDKPRPPIDEELLREHARQADEENTWVDSEEILAELKKQD